MRVKRLLGLAVLGLTACSHAQPPKPTRYILDSGTTGWIKVFYNRADSPELPVEDGFAVVRFSDLKVFTHSRMNPSWDQSEFYYQTPDGKRVRLSKDGTQRRLWGFDKLSDADGDREVFFVGTQQQFGGTLKSVSEVGAGLLEPKSAPPSDGKDLPNPLDSETVLPK